MSVFTAQEILPVYEETGYAFLFVECVIHTKGQRWDTLLMTYHTKPIMGRLFEFVAWNNLAKWLNTPEMLFRHNTV